MIKGLLAWFMAVVWSMMVRKGLGYDASHILNWGGAIVAFLGFLAMTWLFSV